MDTPLSPRSPLDSLEIHDTPIPAGANGTVLVPNGPTGPVVVAAPVQSSGSSSQQATLAAVVVPSTSRNPTTSSCSSSTSTASIYSSSGGHANSANINNNNNNNNHVIINSPAAHPVPPPVPVLVPQIITISQSASPATPASDIVMIGGSESAVSLPSDRRVPIVPPRRCRTRSPTPNTSHGKLPYFPMLSNFSNFLNVKVSLAFLRLLFFQLMLWYLSISPNLHFLHEKIYIHA